MIDFPGVDDRDKSIPDLAELLLSLTRIVVFVVDYRYNRLCSNNTYLVHVKEYNKGLKLTYEQQAKYH